MNRVLFSAFVTGSANQKTGQRLKNDLNIIIPKKREKKQTKHKQKLFFKNRHRAAEHYREYL